jgi:hypothetical protein
LGVAELDFCIITAMNNVIISGSGPLFDRLTNQINQTQFRSLSDTDNALKVWAGEGTPGDDYQIWIKKTNHTDFHLIIKELKDIIKNNPNLEMVGVDNIHSIPVMPNMCAIIGRDNVVRTFQNQFDLDNYLIERFAVSTVDF